MTIVGKIKNTFSEGAPRPTAGDEPCEFTSRGEGGRVPPFIEELHISFGKWTKEVEIAEKIARNAGKLLREGFFGSFTVENKGRVDLVTEYDLASEKLIRETLLECFPEDGFHGEEGGGRDFHHGRVWVVDPLDGTTNFTRRFPIFAVSIALFVEGEVKVGIVYNPVLDEMFVAGQGGGAYLNGKKIEVSSVKEMQKALGVTGFPYVSEDCLNWILEKLRFFLPNAQGIRRTGAAAVDLCYVAAGIFDFFYERKLNPWDVAAGGLIIKEAGGQVTGFEADKNFFDHGELLASNGYLHSRLLQIVSGAIEP